MALRIKIKTPYGVDVDYFKVMDTIIHWHTQTAELRVAGFASAKAKDEGAKPLVAESIQIWPENFPFDPERPLVKDAYNHIKTLAKYKDALDV